jgi:hypothetical protein
MQRIAQVVCSLFLAISLCPNTVLANVDHETSPGSLEQKQKVIVALQQQIEHWRSLSTDEMREELRAAVQEKQDAYLQSGVESPELEIELADAFTVIEFFDDDTKELYIAGLESILQTFTSSSCSAMGVGFLPFALWPCTMGIVAGNWQHVDEKDSTLKTVGKYVANTGLTALLVATVPADIVWDILLLGAGTGYAVCSGISHAVSKK